MSKRGAVAALAALVLILSGTAGWSESRADEAKLPPTDLKLVGDHWTAWDPPAPGPNDYLIQKGDTLWDLAQAWLGDPYLWPQIWDENRYVLDSHWIYPGDPLVRPGQPTVVPPEGIPPVAQVDPGDSRDTGETGEPGDTGGEETGEGQARTGETLEPMEPILRPVADATDLYCSGYIEHKHVPAEVWVADAETEALWMAEGDVIYLSRGRDAGVRAGDELTILRRVGEVKHPTTGRDLGEFVQRLGKVRVMIAHETSATAMIEHSCDGIRAHDELQAWESIPTPMRSSMPDFDRYDPAASGGPQGTVVSLSPNRSVVGAGHIIYTDLGRTSGVQPGDVLTVYRDNSMPDLPRLMIGQAVVLTVGVETSSAKLTTSARESMLGDGVEIVR